MRYLSQIFAPTNNRRLNELVGFLLCVSALLLFLALASYSPLDPSFNSASVLTGSRAARNWIGIVGAMVPIWCCKVLASAHFCFRFSLQCLGCAGFVRAKSFRQIAKFLGGLWLLIFVPALLALLPGHLRWMDAIPIEGLLGRVVGDLLIHYFNLAGAYIVCASMLAVALYFSTAFSFAACRSGRRRASLLPLPCGIDGKIGRKRGKSAMQKELEKRRAAQTSNHDADGSPAAILAPQPQSRASEPREPALSGRLRKHSEDRRRSKHSPQPQPSPEVTERADSAQKPKTTMPRIAGGFKLPPSSLLHRPDEQQAVDADELKLLAQVLTEKYAEFDVHGQITQINPGPGGHDF